MLSGSVPDIPFSSAALPNVLLRAVAASGAVQGITISGSGDDHPLVYANESFLRLTGYLAADILGRNCRFLQGPETDRTEVARLADGLRRHRDTTAVIRNYRRDGTPFWNRVSISPIRDPSSGRVTHFIGTQIDVTDLIDRVGPTGR
ncbi:PAS domain-containing protein [Nakamurella sp.]|uniref:PAS domain-containing protein n=1 Tax=Nakamurella sp. TaxID=1869182 RepID=UPI00378527FD